MKKRLKIIHVLFSKGFAGTERSTAESCNHQSLNHDVVLVCGTKPERKSGASILRNLNSNVKIIQVNPSFFLRRNLQKIIDKEQPDIVHAHLRRSTKILKKCNTSASKISTLHIGINAPEFLEMDGLIAISPWQLKKIPKGYNGKVEWIRNSIVPHTQPDPALTQKLRADIASQNDNTFIVGGIGRLTKVKGWDVLIQAFIKANLPGGYLVIIGEGKDEADFLKLAKNYNNIRFLSFRSNVKDYYSAFDLFVCPSRKEPMGRVVLEALDAGTPVIASNIEGPNDTLSEFPGEVFESENIESLKEVLMAQYKKWNLSGGKTRLRPDLTSHYIENTSQSMVGFYYSTMSN